MKKPKIESSLVQQEIRVSPCSIRIRAALALTPLLFQDLKIVECAERDQNGAVTLFNEI